MPAIALFAFFLKGVMGTGTTTVIVALGSQFVEPKLTIVLASFINIFGGLSMINVDPVPLPRGYWMPIALFMIIGSILGAIALDHIPNQLFQIVLGVVFLITAFWFLLRTPLAKRNTDIQKSASPFDLIVGGFAGFCGGFVGVNAPPLVLHFSLYLDKSALRRLLVLIFIPAAVAQTVTFSINGLLSREVMIWGVLTFPSMILGIYLGNRSFHKISEVWFRRALGVMLVIVSIRLILRGFGSI